MLKMPNRKFTDLKKVSKGVMKLTCVPDGTVSLLYVILCCGSVNSGVSSFTSNTIKVVDLLLLLIGIPLSEAWQTKMRQFVEKINVTHNLESNTGITSLLVSCRCAFSCAGSLFLVFLSLALTTYEF